jgi:hypothetical protein
MAKKADADARRKPMKDSVDEMVHNLGRSMIHLIQPHISMVGAKIYPNANRVPHSIAPDVLMSNRLA